MASPLCKTLGVATRIAAWSETSAIVTWISRDHGRLATVLKGAYRPRSLFLGQFDLLQTVELVYYRSARAGAAHVARECALVTARPAFRRHWQATAAATYLADLLTRICPIEAPQPGLYPFLERALDLLSAHPRTDSLLLWLEIKLLDELGLTPRLQHCAGCGRELEPGRTETRLAPARGGLLCGACAQASTPDARPVRPDLLATLQFWQRAREPGAALHTRLGTHQRQEMESFLGLFISHHLELDLTGRTLAYELASQPRRAPLPPAPHRHEGAPSPTA